VIFIHLQRTGGNSIHKEFQELDQNLILNIEFDLSLKRTRHCFASDIKAIIDNNIFNNYTKFCVVRNPFDRMVSWYSMLKQGFGNDRVVMPYKAVKTVGDEVIIEVNKNTNSFEDFIMLPRNHKSGLFERFYVNQLDYISENNNILVDRILRFENLSCDFNNLAKEIGFAGKLPHVNKSKHREDYRNYYTKNAKEAILQRFKQDFEYFGYSF
jgi:sporulation protein YlmC with PRC-barrel domain